MPGRKRRRPRLPDGEIAGRVWVDIVISHLNAWQFLSSALKSQNDRDILFRVSSPAAAWRSLFDTYS